VKKFVFFLLLFTSASAVASFSGTWRDRKDGNIVISVTENGKLIDGKLIDGTSPSSGFNLWFTGNRLAPYFGPTKANVKITRINLQNNCVTVMWAKWTLVNDFEMTYVIVGSDARCDLPHSYTERRIFVRI
jgi:hypothetical protein